MNDYQRLVLELNILLNLVISKKTLPYIQEHEFKFVESKFIFKRIEKYWQHYSPLESFDQIIPHLNVPPYEIPLRWFMHHFLSVPKMKDKDGAVYFMATAMDPWPDDQMLWIEQIKKANQEQESK